MDYYLNLYTSLLLPSSYSPPSLFTSIYPSSSSPTLPFSPGRPISLLFLLLSSLSPYLLLLSSLSPPPPLPLPPPLPPPLPLPSLSTSISPSLYKHFGNASGTKGFSGSEPRLPGLSLKALQSCLVAVSGGFACVASRLVLSEFLLHGSQVKG